MRNSRVMQIGCLPLCMMFLGLIACTDASFDKSDITVYGKPVDYLQQEEIKFPDFDLYYLGDEKAQSASQVAYDADRSYQFEIANGAEKIRVTWSDVNNSKRYERFNVGDNYYFLQIKSSYFQNRELNPGELVVWDFVQFQKNSPPLPKIGTAQEASELVSYYQSYLKALQGGGWELVQTFLSPNRKAILERSKNHARMSEQEIVERLAASTQRAKGFSMQQAMLSSEEARLHLVAQSTQGTQIIGVLFVKEAEKWKIESESAMPNDETGKQWVKLFLNQ